MLLTETQGFVGRWPMAQPLAKCQRWRIRWGLPALVFCVFVPPSLLHRSVLSQPSLSHDVLSAFGPEDKTLIWISPGEEALAVGFQS